MEKVIEVMFDLDELQIKKLNEWKKTLPEKYTGAIGGRYTYSFTPTSLGVVVKVKDDVTGKEIDLTDYNW